MVGDKMTEDSGSSGTDTDEDIVHEVTRSLPQYAQVLGKRIIIQFIMKNKKSVNWDKETLEVILNGKIERGTNILKILRFLLSDNEDEKVTTIPLKTEEFRESLLDIGVPESWLMKVENEKEISEEEEDNNDVVVVTSVPPVGKKQTTSIGSTVYDGETYFTGTEEEEENDDPDPDVTLNLSGKSSPTMNQSSRKEKRDTRRTHYQLRKSTRRQTNRWSPYSLGSSDDEESD